MLSRKPKSTNPLIVSLALELFARYLRRPAPPSAALERSEYGRRDRDLLWYLLRGSIWESYTRYIFRKFSLIRALTLVLDRPKLMSFVDKTSGVPVLNLMSAFIKDWIPLIEDYYYCKHPTQLRVAVSSINILPQIPQPSANFIFPNLSSLVISTLERVDSVHMLSVILYYTSTLLYIQYIRTVIHTAFASI